MSRVVIALGGNALGNTPLEQIEKANITAKAIIPIIKDGYKVVLTHGNGPQVGLINLAFEEGSKTNPKVCEMPFPECNAMSEGYIGYHLQNAISNALVNENINKDVISLVTRVVVDENDQAFKNPTKPIGSFYTYEEAKLKPFPTKEDAGRGYRRIVPSPKPIAILEANSIKYLMDYSIVICTGGGGIPVVKKDNNYIGIPSVIDKDFASSKLSEMIEADILLILTAVDNVSLNFNTPDQINLHNVSLSDLIKYNENHEFSEGSMKPKVEAAIEFVKIKKSNIAIITSIENAYEALLGNKGTIIRNI